MIMIDVNNGRSVSLEQEMRDDDILITKYGSKDEVESRLYIPVGDMVMLLNYWQNCKDGKEQSDYIKPFEN